MYTITFARSKSKHFQKALNHAVTMGASWDGATATLEIPAGDLLTAYEDLLILFQYVSKWESLKATFNGKPVPPYRWVFQVWNTVNNCKLGKEQSVDPRYCWASVDTRGWGCRQLQRIQRYSKGTPRYKTSNRYWYNFGEFTAANTWGINKDLIFDRIKKEMEDKALFLCPFFNVGDIEEAIRNLPDFVKTDNVNFSHYCTSEYVDGKKRRVPVNIRHVNPPKEMTTLQEIINNDPWKYQQN